MKETKKIISFIHYVEKLKTELRHATRSDRQRESVADHSWRLILFIMLVAPKLSLKIDLLKTIKIAAIHDITEIEAKDIPALEHISNKKVLDKKNRDERRAIIKIKKKLGGDDCEICDLWWEYENLKTNEAKLVSALDKLEGELQFLQDPVRKFKLCEQDSIKRLLEQTTKLCEIDPFLQKLDKLTLNDRKRRINHTSKARC